MPLQTRLRQDFRPGKMRARVNLTPYHHILAVARGYALSIQVFVTGNQFERRELMLQALHQFCQSGELGLRISLRHGLVLRVIPVWIAALVNQFNSDAVLIMTPYMMSNPVIAHILQDGAIAVDVIVAGVAGLAGFIVDHFGKFTGFVQVRQLGAVNHQQRYRIAFALFKA